MNRPVGQPGGADLRTLCVVPCGKAKIWDRDPDRGPTPAREAYIGSFASGARKYAERFYDHWIVLSARYGFLWPDDPVPGPYEAAFGRPRGGVVSDEKLREQVRRLKLDQFDEIVVVAGRAYADAVRRAFSGSGVPIWEPLKGLTGMGSMLSAMKRARETGRPL